MRVNEIFDSIQGEGVLHGMWATFIRLQGCPVGCEWCDTKYAQGKGGTEMSVEDIVSRVNACHVVITGGEPLLWNLDELLLSLRQRRVLIQIETSGFRNYIGERRPDWLTWSPKKKLNYETKILTPVDEVKWVVDEDLTWENVETHLGLAGWTVLMPEGCPPRPEMVAKALQMLKEHPYPRISYGDRLQWRIGVK